MDQIYHRLKKEFPQCVVKLQEPMKNHTTFRVGGNAAVLVEAGSVEEIRWLVGECSGRQVPFMVIGKGSNLLVPDAGYAGVVIKISEGFSHIGVEENEIHTQSGATLAKVAVAAVQNSLAGFEFASGIPGTIGGAVCMNAGAYGGEMKDVVKAVTVLQNDAVVTLENAGMHFGYRKSIVTEQPMIILSAVLALTPGEKEMIKEKMQTLNRQRKEKQPLEYPSAGSTFKRPEGYFAGKLIMDAGLKGYSIGGAQVSEKHAGFIINTGNATASDILQLIQYVQEAVHQKFGVQLETEVKLIQ